MKTVLITGSSGLVGSSCVRYFSGQKWTVHGIDNNMRRSFFGPDGDTQANLERLRLECPLFQHHGTSIQDCYHLVMDLRPDLVIHAAAQPSHDYAARQPKLDFAINANGTIDLLEAARHCVPESPFVFLSTNKVYGDRPNCLIFEELPTRWETTHPCWKNGIDENVDIDHTTHSLFGVSKLAADLMVQEYGRYFGMKTVCFRAGCLTGGAHAGAEQHGFLAYLARCCREGRPYTVFGYKGKQVRDQLHAFDVARACEEFYNNPSSGAVYNLGGGRSNSISVLEAIDAVERITGKKLDWKYVDKPRKGDHIWWITDTSRFRANYPGWSVTQSLGTILDELCFPAIETFLTPAQTACTLPPDKPAVPSVRP